MKDRMISFKISDETYGMLKSISDRRDTTMTAVFIESIRTLYKEMQEESDD